MQDNALLLGRLAARPHDIENVRAENKAFLSGLGGLHERFIGLLASTFEVRFAQYFHGSSGNRALSSCMLKDVSVPYGGEKGRAGWTRGCGYIRMVWGTSGSVPAHRVQLSQSGQCE